MENKKGLGDIVEDTIKKITFNRVKPCASCKRRKAFLNSIKLPYSNYNPEKEKK